MRYGYFDEEKKELFIQKIDETLPDIIDSKDEEKTAWKSKFISWVLLCKRRC